MQLVPGDVADGSLLFAIRYIRKNPNDRRDGVIYLGISLISYIGCALWGLLTTEMTLHPWGLK